MILNCLICGKQMYGQNEEDDICPDCKQKHKQLKFEDDSVRDTGDMPYLDCADKKFVKADNGKLQWSLLPFNELEDVVKVLMKGAEKYSPDNWKRCDDITRYKDALMRHVVSYIKGDTYDKDDKLPHLAHAICNCLFLMWFNNTKEGDKNVNN